jgi:hypothetical protein
MKFFQMVGVMLLLLVSGCASTEEAPPLPRAERFNEEQLAPFAGLGNSSIVGEAFLKTGSGEVKKGAGETVWLVPVVAYTTEHLYKEKLTGRKLAPPLDKRVYRFMRNTKADSEGRFRFDQIQPGEYYIYALILWSVPSMSVGGEAGSKATGGFALSKVRVKANEQVSVVVTSP